MCFWMYVHTMIWAILALTSYFFNAARKYCCTYMYMCICVYVYMCICVYVYMCKYCCILSLRNGSCGTDSAKNSAHNICFEYFSVFSAERPHVAQIVQRLKLIILALIIFLSFLQNGLMPHI